MNAKDWAERLRADPVYQAKLSEQAERAGSVRAEEGELLRILASRGYPADSLEELAERYRALPEDLSRALVECLAVATDGTLQESIARVLGAAGKSFDARPLVQLFESTSSTSLRWAIANTLAELAPLETGAWLLDALKNPGYGKAREMLALAVARTSTASEANPVLLSLLDDMPGHAALALAECGTAKELRILEGRLAYAKGWVKKEIEKAIRAISRRL